jgi:hypothetical protein
LLALTQQQGHRYVAATSQRRAGASPVFVASLVDAIGALREIMIPSAQVSRTGIRREGFLFGLASIFRDLGDASR